MRRGQTRPSIAENAVEAWQRDLRDGLPCELPRAIGRREVIAGRSTTVMQDMFELLRIAAPQ